MLIRGKHRGKASQRGFTLLEVMIAAAILSVVGLGLTQGLQLANQTNDTVQDRSTQNRQTRKGLDLLRNELKSTRESLLSIVTESSGNHRLTFQVPVDGSGVTSWGVYEKTLGPDNASQNREGWELRYAVVPDVQGTPQLVRQIVDDGGALQAQRTLINGLVGSDDPAGPAFTLQATGSVWELRLVTRPNPNDGAQIDTFHVRLRN